MPSESGSLHALPSSLQAVPPAVPYKCTQRNGRMVVTVWADGQVDGGRSSACLWPVSQLLEREPSLPQRERSASEKTTAQWDACTIRTRESEWLDTPAVLDLVQDWLAILLGTPSVVHGFDPGNAVCDPRAESHWLEASNQPKFKVWGVFPRTSISRTSALINRSREFG